MSWLCWFGHSWVEIARRNGKREAMHIDTGVRWQEQALARIEHCAACGKLRASVSNGQTVERQDPYYLAAQLGVEV